MSWLRIDDGFAEHPKVLALKTPQRRWTWLQILVYTCRYDSPLVPPEVAEFIPKADAKFLSELVALRLLDDNDGSLEVHHWEEYNGRVAEERHRAAERKRAQRERDKPVTETGQARDETVTDDDENVGHERDSHSDSRARRPSPSPSPKEQEPLPALTNNSNSPSDQEAGNGYRPLDEYTEDELEVLAELEAMGPLKNREQELRDIAAGGAPDDDIPFR